jgi:hypothetical protein
MSNPTITPGYGYVICSHDDPKRSHYFECGRWVDVAGRALPVGHLCEKLPNRKPVEIPDGWELVPEDGVLEPDDKAYFSVGGDWDFRPHYWPPGSRPSDRHRIDARVVAFIRRKPVQPTFEPSKPAVDWSKPIQTRAGRKARLLGEIIGRDDPFAVAVMTEDGREDVLYYFASGKFYVNATCVNDIINAPERIERDVWLNVYESGGITPWADKDTADTHALEGRIACVRVQIDCEKGEGL